MAYFDIVASKTRPSSETGGGEAGDCEKPTAAAQRGCSGIQEGPCQPAAAQDEASIGQKDSSRASTSDGQNCKVEFLMK